MTNLSLAWIAAASSAGILIESYDFLIAGAALPFLSQLGICQYGLMFAVQALWVNCFYPVCLLLRFGADEEYSSVLLSLLI
jgi:hypothetical protein